MGRRPATGSQQMRFPTKILDNYWLSIERLSNLCTIVTTSFYDIFAEVFVNSTEAA